MSPTDVRRDRGLRGRAANGSAVERDLELGVLYLADRKLDARSTALDRVPPSIAPTRWRSSSERRSAFSSTSPTRPPESRQRNATPTAPLAS